MTSNQLFRKLKVYKNSIHTATNADQEENRETSLPHVWPDTERAQKRHAGQVCSTNASFVKVFCCLNEHKKKIGISFFIQKPKIIVDAKYVFFSILWDGMLAANSHRQHYGTMYIEQNVFMTVRGIIITNATSVWGLTSTREQVKVWIVISTHPCLYVFCSSMDPLDIHYVIHGENIL